MFELKVVEFFSAAHSLRGYKGKCEACHGHNWKVEALVKGLSLDSSGLVLDFKDLKSILMDVLEQLDHKDLNQVDFFKQNNPSSENIAYFIYEQLKTLLEGKSCELSKVNVWEQRDSCVSYWED